MTDEQKSEARQLHIDGATPAKIAEALGASITEVNAALGLDATESDADAKPRPTPVQRPRQMDPDHAVALALNRELKRRTSGLGYGGLGYRPDPDGGKLRDGSPAPAFGERIPDPNRRGRGRFGL